MPHLTDLSVQDEPYDYYRARLAAGPVWHEADIDLYVIGGYEEARTALADVDTFSNRPTRKRGAVDPAADAYNRVLEEQGWGRCPTLQRTDPPVHTRYRKLLNRVFTPRTVRTFTPRLEEITQSLIDAFIARGTCEFVSEFALPLPGVFFAEQLGLDQSDYPTFRRWADAMLATATRTMTVEEAEAEAEIEVEAQRFLAKEFDRRRAHPGDDLISLLVHAHGDDEQPLSTDELQDLMAQMITGGFETTTSGLTNAALLLAQHPDHAVALREHPETLKGFVEELLRFESPVQGLWRTATHTVEIGDVTIPEGAAVMIRYGAANRDPCKFRAPESFDPAREEASSHIAFGVGAHYCVGASLARQELTTGLAILLARLDDIELAEPLEPPIHAASFFLRSIKRLPLRFRAADRDVAASS